MQRYMEERKHGDMEALIEYVRLLRYGPKASQDPGRPLTRIKDIARMLRVSHQHVRSLLRSDPSKPDYRRVVRRGPRAKLTAVQEAYLTHPFTLQKWACKTLSERVVLFHRQFPEVKITVPTLQKLYMRKGIKRKALRFVKTLKY